MDLSLVLQTPQHISLMASEWPKVIILDPATGTGTFIESAIDLIHETMTKHWKDDGASSSEINELWNDYVESKLLTRIFGFELMIAPYAIAHLKIGFKVRETELFFQVGYKVKHILNKFSNRTQAYC